MHDIKVIVEQADGHKCPRCWKYHGIPDNPHGMCDGCCRSLLDCRSEDFFGDQVGRDWFRDLQLKIRESKRQQVDKYKKHLTNC